MKKKILILLAVLIGVYVVFSVLDSGEYRVEKKMWQLQQKFSEIAQDPKAVPPRQFDMMIARYRALAEKHPESRYVPQMYALIGALYVMNKDYESARTAYHAVVDQFSQSPDVVSKALLDIGNAYMLENRVEDAVEVYLRILKNYERTETGFKMPMLLVGLYRNLGQETEVRQYLVQAERFYRGIAVNDEENELLRITASQALASVYMAQQRWEDVIKTLKGVLEEYGDSRFMNPKRLSVITRALNIVYIGRLRDFDRAIAMYESFIDEHPGHVLNPYLTKVIESIELLKEYKTEAVVPEK